MRVTVTTCRQCEKEFTPDRAYLRRTVPAKFCSRQCWQRSRWKKRPCAGCKKALPQNTPNKFCSRACRVEHHGFRAKLTKMAQCRVCEKTFEYQPSGKTGRFCSRKCYDAHRASHNKPKSCKQCGTAFIRINAAQTNKTRFCSPRCVRDYWKATGHPLCRGGTRSGDRGKDWPKTAKAIRRRDDFVCQSCGEEAYVNALPVDHIVPYRIAKRLADKNPLLNPNDERNLVTLCMWCHMQKTHTEKDLLEGRPQPFVTWASWIVGKERVEVAMRLFGIWPYPELTYAGTGL